MDLAFLAEAYDLHPFNSHTAPLHYPILPLVRPFLTTQVIYGIDSVHGGT
jgi:hypothetical protein